jgi:predicted nucleic acid-binding Zn finger protein
MEWNETVPRGPMRNQRTALSALRTIFVPIGISNNYLWKIVFVSCTSIIIVFFAGHINTTVLYLCCILMKIYRRTDIYAGMINTN